MVEIYVALNGNDYNSGTIDKPIKSLEKARDIIRTIEKNQDINIYLREGRYFRSSTFELDERDSGNSVARVCYRAFNNEKVYIDGGIVIKPDKVKKVTDNSILNRIVDLNARDFVCEIDLSEYNVNLACYGNRGSGHGYVCAPNELFINNKAQTVAQYPNLGEKLIPLRNVVDSGSIPVENDFSSRGATFKFEIERPKYWEKAENAYVSGIFNWEWADDTLEIEKINSEEKTITTKYPHSWGFAGKEDTQWRIVNLIEEIDIPGEYYIDLTAQKIYFYPPCDMQNSLIQLSVLEETLVALENVSFVSFENIVFENARGSAVYIEGGTSNEVKGCTFRNLGTVAVQIGQGAEEIKNRKHNECDKSLSKPKGKSRILGFWTEMIYDFPAWNTKGGTNHRIADCEIYSIGAGGIILGGGDRKTLTPAGNCVENCHIYSVNRLEKTYRPGISILGVGNCIRNCEIHNLSGFAVHLRGNNHIIEYVKMYDALQDVADAGVIYMGRDPSEVGNIIRYNFIYNIRNNHEKSNSGVCAIYFDDFAVYNEVYGNYFYNIVDRSSKFFSTIFWNGGGQTSVGNNILIDCLPGLNPNIQRNSYEAMHSEAIIMQRISAKEPDDFRGVDITSAVYKNAYPYLYDTYVNNYLHGTPYWNNVILVNQYHIFEDENPEHMNFQIKKDYILRTKHVIDKVHGIDNKEVEFEIVDFKRIGLIGEE